MTILESKLFNWKNNKSLRTILFDSAIIAGMVGFAALSDVPSIENAWIVVKVSGIAFFSQLAFEKGIKRFKGGK